MGLFDRLEMVTQLIWSILYSSSTWIVGDMVCYMPSIYEEGRGVGVGK
jgi:hypothetical protein